MRTWKLHAAGLAAVVMVGAPARAFASEGERSGAKKESHALVKQADDLQWSKGPASLPPGAESVVLEGDPAKEGMFTLRIKMPAGYRIPPHTHPKVERVTVLSGELGLGMGPEFNEDTLEKMSEGSFFVLQPGMQHFVRAADETVVQLNAQGPWAIKYVRASDDPRNQPQARKPPADETGSRRK
jgi:quercetin dioxygenase-like cupin family protein